MVVDRSSSSTSHNARAAARLADTLLTHGQAITAESHD
jgi:hypothetical protein